jgi:iron complex transport system ATP-binding protein
MREETGPHAALQVRSLSKRYGRFDALRGVDLEVARGEAFGLVGANGAGKTTLLHTLLGLHRADAGSIHLAGRPLGDWTLAAAATIRGFLPQFIHDSFSAPVLDLVLMGRHPHLSRWQWESADDIARARSALAAMDLAALEARDVTTLSGGERQRTAIAALLAQDPQVLLLDEPIAHLDLHHQVVVLDHLARLARERDKAVLLSLHDPNLARARRRRRAVHDDRGPAPRPAALPRRAAPAVLAHRRSRPGARFHEMHP